MRVIFYIRYVACFYACFYAFRRRAGLFFFFLVMALVRSFFYFIFFLVMALVTVFFFFGHLFDHGLFFFGVHGLFF